MKNNTLEYLHMKINRRNRVFQYYRRHTILADLYTIKDIMFLRGCTFAESYKKVADYVIQRIAF